MSTDEQAIVLKEIRDALLEQTALAKSQHLKYAKMTRQNQIISIIVWFPLMLAAAWLIVAHH